MARAFTPSRSMIYGSPDRQALIGVTSQVMGQLVDWDQDNRNEEMQAEYRRQTSNASIAMEKERHNLGKFMDEHQNDPGSWRTEFAKNRERIRKGVLDGITQPQAKQAAELELNESLASWESWIDESAAKQTAFNTNSDFNTHLDGIYKESRQYRDQTDMLAHLESGLSLIEGGYNGGTLPVDKLPTREVAEAEKRNVTRHIVGNYLLQQALASGDDSYIDKANEVAPRSILDDQQEKPLFGPEELGDLRKRYKDSAGTAKAAAKAEREARAYAFESAATDAILAGKFTFKNEKGEDVNWLDATIANQDLEPGTKRTLEEKYRARVNSQNKTKLYSDTETAKARIAIWSETDPKKQFDLLFGHAAGLGEKETESLRELIFDPKQNFSQLASDMNAKITAIRDVHTQTLTDTKEKESVQTKLTWLQDQLLRQLEANPDWSASQQKEAVEAGLEIARSYAAKQAVKNLTMWQVNMGMGGRWYPYTPQPDAPTPSGLPEPQSRDEFRKTVARLKGSDATKARAYHKEWIGKWEK